MANSKVVLLMRVRLKDGERIYAPPAIARNWKIKPLSAVIDGKVEHHPEGVYALRYREDDRLRYKQIGTDVDAAETANFSWFKLSLAGRARRLLFLLTTHFSFCQPLG